MLLGVVVYKSQPEILFDFLFGILVSLVNLDLVLIARSQSRWLFPVVL